MTREEAIICKIYLEDLDKYHTCNEYKLLMGLLEQEPILDKIRAEIAVLDDADYDYEGYYKAVTDALQIIDKYRQEG